jgi:hypothetical protein
MAVSVVLDGSFFSLMHILIDKTGVHIEYAFLDYAVGAVILSVVASLLLGSVGSSDIPSFVSNIVDATWWKVLLVFLGGACFGFANVTILQAIALLGQISVAIALGLSAVLAVFLTYALYPDGRIILLSIGVFVLLCGIAASSLCEHYRVAFRIATRAQLARAPRSERSTTAAMRRLQEVDKSTNLASMVAEEGSVRMNSANSARHTKAIAEQASLAAESREPRKDNWDVVGSTPSDSASHDNAALAAAALPAKKRADRRRFVRCVCARALVNDVLNDARTSRVCVED